MNMKHLLFVAENRKWIKILLLAAIMLVAAVEPAMADGGWWGPDWIGGLG